MVRFLCQLMIPLILWKAPATQFVSTFQSVDYRKPPAAISEISYLETISEIDNPGIGFYTPLYIHYLISGNEVNDYTDHLVHMRLDISQFSGSCNKKGDMELTQDMLDAFEGTLRNLEEHQCTAIVRFAYDPWFHGGATYEPSMEMILHHQKQLGEVMARHEEVIISLECGIFGKWGEMHGSRKCTQENFNQVIDQWLEVLPDSIPISVRTPGYYCDWLGIDRDSMAQYVTVPGQKEYRVGIYNDGYLASGTDWGTFENREEEINWLSEQAKHTVYGGEIGTINRKEKVQPTTEYMSEEAFRTHTTYLNSGWHESVLGAMKMEDYEGPDERYHGEKGYTYISNHMGYRFVVRNVKVTKEVPRGDMLALIVDIENVGFANLVKPKDLTLILKKGDTIVYRPVLGFSEEKNEFAENWDARYWDSQETTELRLAIRTDEELPKGEYQIYLRLAAKDQERENGLSGYPVKFANDGSVFDEELGANFLGSFILTEGEYDH